MWPTLVFLALVMLVFVDFWWRERRYQKQRAQAKQEYTTELLRRQQEACAQSQAQQQALFDSMVEGVLLLDRKGKIEMINPSLEQLFELKTDIRGQTLLEALRLPQLSDLADRVQKERAVAGFELDLTGAHQCRLEVNASAILDRAANPKGAIFVFHDLTRLRQLENSRQEFVANVSHELRTPLSMIKGFVETLLDGAKDDPELSTRFLHKIEKHTARLTYLIEDLLTISKLDSGQIVMNAQMLDLRATAQRVVEDLQARAVEKKTTIENLLPPDLSAKADAERLEQVFFNLIENAIKYGRNEGRVTIGAKAALENRIEVWVRDDGPGIPAEAKDRVFERFFRVDKARARETGGTGLGLAIVKHIVQAHGGRVWVESQLGQGTTFYFALPQT